MPKMTEVLARELGVNPDALTRLGLGYLPHIVFTKGPNYDGHWTFPERDSTGRITGLSLRNRLDGRRKPMFPGSKHGLFFVPAMAGGNTARGDAVGPRWVRVSEAGVDCPVCNKPDWCLVDGTQPDDPAAVICPRTPSAEDYGEAGYLHVLDPERWERLNAGTKSTNPLAPSRFPVIIVEGATDTAAVLGLGLVAVGRPSATGGLTTLANLVRGRRVVIFGENDKKLDGFWPGKHGAEKTHKAIEGVCANPRIVFPPGEYKDVRAWISGEKLGTEAFLEHIEKYAGQLVDAPGTSEALPDDNFATVAGAILERVYTDADRPTLLRCQESWFVYGANGWAEEQSREDVRSEVINFLGRTKYKKVDMRSKTETLAAFNPSKSFVSSVLDCLVAAVPRPPLPPVWLDGRTTPEPSRLLCFHNGMLDVDRFMAYDSTVTPYTSDLFTVSRLPFEYNPATTCPRWDQWLEETLGDDPNKIALLQEWFGYNLIPDNRHEKMLLMVGPRRSGKGTALSVMTALLGDAHAGTSLQNFTREFGLHNLVGKLSATMPDAQAPDYNKSQCLQTLLEIVGNDDVTINRKFKSQLTKRLTCRFTMASNQLPDLPDQSLALAARLMILPFNQSFVGHEDIGLKDYFRRNEMPGIMNWALDGLRRLLTAETFTLPADHNRLQDDFARLANPCVEFAETWLIENPAAKVEQEAVYEAWKVYASERGEYVRRKQWLWSRLKVIFPYLKFTTETVDGHTVKYIVGLDMQDFARNAKRRIG
jgi:putative DNA primase/helicase